MGLAAWYFRGTSSMHFRLGSHLFVKIKYVFPRGGTCYWQRKPPKDLADRFPRGPLKTNLNTSDPAVIARKVDRLNREFETLCEAMRRDPTLRPTPPRKEAERLLRSHGLPPSGRGADELAASLFFDKLNEKREAHALASEDPEEAYRAVPLVDFLSPSEVEAVRLLNSEDAFLLSDVCELYLKEHRKSTRANFGKLEADCRRVFRNLIALVGDKEFTATTRDDVKRYRDHSLAKGNKPKSVRRQLNVLRAAFAHALADKGLTIANVLIRLNVPGEDDTATTRQRVPFSPAELSTLAHLCREADDPMRWILALQADTGTAVGEVTGLRIEDIRLTDEVPHIDLSEYQGRTLKNNGNRVRFVPLFGLSLWAAERILASAKPGQAYAFPQYVSRDGTIKSTSASNALNAWMRSRGLPHTTHELRHTFKDRMRNALVRTDIQSAIGGWGKLTKEDGYGRGFLLRVLCDGLRPVFADADSSTTG